MSLREQQCIFLKNFAKLILWCFENGYTVTAGELLRTEEQQKIYLSEGKTKALRSLHQDKMAGDLLLFINGIYLTDTKSYKPAGDYWVTLHPQNRWGGDWNKNGKIEDENFKDGNHFEMQIL